jgi:hypothetical protein
VGVDGSQGPYLGPYGPGWAISHLLNMLLRDVTDDGSRDLLGLSRGTSRHMAAALGMTVVASSFGGGNQRTSCGGE